MKSSETGSETCNHLCHTLPSRGLWSNHCPNLHCVRWWSYCQLDEYASSSPAIPSLLQLRRNCQGYLLPSNVDLHPHINNLLHISDRFSFFFTPWRSVLQAHTLATGVVTRQPMRNVKNVCSKATGRMNALGKESTCIGRQEQHSWKRGLRKSKRKPMVKQLRRM